MVLDDDRILHYNIFEDKVISEIPDLDIEVSSLIVEAFKPVVKILGKAGELIIWDYQKQEKIYETRILIFSELLFAFQKGNPEHLYLLKKAGNLSLVNWSQRVIIHENIIQEEDISSFDFNHKKALLFTASERGRVIMS